MESEKFGIRIRELRTKKGYSQRQLAEMMMVSNTSVANWESGRRLPDISMLSKLAECLGVESYVLLDELQGEGEPPKIIVVEDAPIILKGILRTLEEELPDTDVWGFLTGEEALEYAHANRIAMAFLDIELSGESGIDLARQLKDIEGRTNIIYLTCHPEYTHAALETYCSGYILKPLTPEKLHRELDNLRFPVRGLKL